MSIARQTEPTAFSIWIRTGRWPRPGTPRHIELKFNPWHDPRNGRFTFAGAGNFYGPGSAVRSAGHIDQDVPPYGRDPASGTVSSMEDVHAWAAKEREKFAGKPNQQAHRRRIDEAVREYEKDLSPKPPSPLKRAINFYKGEIRAILDTDKAIIAGFHKLGTDPLGAARGAATGIVGAFNAALEAESTPAYVHLSRAWRTVANASEEELGYGVGIGASNLALTLMPAAIAARVSAVSHLGRASSFAANFEKAAVRTNFNFYEVLSEHAISGVTRGAHRASANRNLYRSLQSHPDLARMFDTMLDADVLRHMSSGKRLLNPPGTVWHHPASRPNMTQLLRATEHTNPQLQPILHPEGVGGFGAHYGN